MSRVGDKITVDGRTLEVLCVGAESLYCADDLGNGVHVPRDTAEAASPAVTLDQRFNHFGRF